MSPSILAFHEKRKTELFYLAPNPMAGIKMPLFFHGIVNFFGVSRKTCKNFLAILIFPSRIGIGQTARQH